MITCSVGKFSKTYSFLEKSLDVVKNINLDEYGRQGVDALRSATPKDSGRTADSWDYKIERKNGSVTINWTNSNIVNGVNIAVIIQYGHATRNGAWVEGYDYINPAIKSIFNKIAESAWKEVTRI